MCSVGRVRRFLKSLDQRFPPLQERSFKKDVEPRVIVASLVASLLFLLAVVSNVGRISSDLTNPEWPWKFSSSDPRTWATITKIFQVCLAMLNIGACSLRLRLGWLASWNWELQILATATLAQVSNSFNSTRWALMLGLEPDQVFLNTLSGSECYEMLALDSITSGLCIFVPIRSCMLWIAPLSGLLIHVSMRATLGSNTSTWYDVMVLVVLAFFSLVGAFSNECTARERFLAVRDVKAHEERLSNQYLAISRILARFCDCVLELDKDCRFCGPHRQFAALVFSSADKSLDGGSFLDHLASGQDHFVELLSEKTPLDQVSDMVPLVLKDSQGREFAAQGYCTCYEDGRGRHHFVGITETQERMPQDACLAPLLDLSSARSSPVRRPRTPSASSGSCVEEPQEVSEKGEISFTFLDNEGLTIIDCSPGFTALGGPLSQEQSLRQWMRPQELHRFSNWMQEMGNMFRRPWNVTLRPPHGEQAGVEYAVKLSVSLLQMTEESEMAFHVLVEEIHQQRRFRWNKNRKRSERCGPRSGDTERGEPDARWPADLFNTPVRL